MTPRRRPSLLVVVLAFVVVAVPTVFAVFPEAAAGRAVGWRVAVLAGWAVAAGVIGYRAALRETADDRARVLGSPG